MVLHKGRSESKHYEKIKESGVLCEIDDGDMKREFGISSSDEDDMDYQISDDNDTVRGSTREASCETIRLNPKAKNVGAPRKL
ncbi:hypothetical protein L917_04560 [Phytophthora nicotianae]|uniref:Uncharacterized protein n=1 Tax=Phytophthora nicotianae TaxID=4792 RepID=W2LLR2_PHYNI|nr:hypothetical protein L917_04560 [Phytophthora nicotianae]ETM51498.1 hypothetical protein L914_04667 [Phytophthora nicotianae]